MQDYRAGATIDLDDDNADLREVRRLRCPLHVLWDAGCFDHGESPIEIWKKWADQVAGASIECGHLMPEEAPEEVLTAVLPFLRRHALDHNQGQELQ